MLRRKIRQGERTRNWGEREIIILSKVIGQGSAGKVTCE